ncbi:MAG: PDZ domain-containing protein, partial [Chlorobi bacterium CHB2]|nr:PDZ domain-containing protein [Chlorobi bacterium CHB2]
MAKPPLARCSRTRRAASGNRAEAITKKKKSCRNISTPLPSQRNFTQALLNNIPFGGFRTMKQRLLLLLSAGLVSGSIAIHAQQTTTAELGGADTAMRIERPHCLSVRTFGGGSYLGVQIEEVTPDKAKEMGLKEEYGVVINKVMEGTAAEKAGLLANDVVVGWNDSRVESTRQLTRLIRETPAGRTVRIGIVRNGSPMTINATIGKREQGIFERFEMEGMNLDSTIGESLKNLKGLKGWKGMESFEGLKGLENLKDFNIRIDTAWSFDTTMPGGCHSFNFGWSGAPEPVWMPSHRPRLGVQMQDLTPQLAKYFGADRNSGALISEVVDSSAAERAGLLAGDIILAIDGKPVNNPNDAARMIREHNEGSVELRILRDRQERTITATLEEAPAMENHLLPQPDGDRQMRRFHFKGGK